MAKPPTYADALKILGKDDSTLLDLAEKLVDGGLGALGVPDLFGIRTELVSKGREALTKLRERISGVSRWDRTQRIDAAHHVLIVTAYIEATTEFLENKETRNLLIADGVDPDELHAALIVEAPTLQVHTALVGSPTHFHGDPFFLAYGRPGKMFFRIPDLPLSFLGRGPVGIEWDQINRTLSDIARRRYEESYLRLAAEVPEFGVWADFHLHGETQARLDTVSAGLDRLNLLLENVSTGRPIERRRRELAATYTSVLSRPLLRSTDAPTSFTLPTLEHAYLAPRGTVTTAAPGARPSEDAWWAELPTTDDLQPVLAYLLTRIEATEAPLVILGHPGAGKSKLTEMLAARLPKSDFVPLRIELRTVPPNAPIHTQIDEGLAATLHTRTSWRELVESADGAIPLVILDGFDELLQATGVNRSDYLEQVQRFQEQQRAMGEPVIVIVTSRTVVADRMRFSVGTPIIRLEPFSEAQIGQMIDIWNEANATSLAAAGLTPPTLASVLPYRELAEQPLLLLMLLIYDADGNALQASGTRFSRAELYEELLTMFARREVNKHAANLPDRDRERRISEELNRLEIVAMAMFARGRQTVTAAELGSDLAVLLPDAAIHPGDTAGLHGAVSDADQVLGRFFFVHESRAQVQAGTASVYEFLHATFGEYLVARMITSALDDLAEDRRRSARRRYSAHLDDGLFYALTSFAALGGRSAVVEFAGDLLSQRLDGRPEDRAEFLELLIELFRDAPFPPANRSFADYAPQRLPITQRQGAYMANVAVLLTLVAEDGIDLAELFPDAEEPWQEWRALAGLWRALPDSQWHGTLDSVRIRHIGFTHGDRSQTVLEREAGEPVNVGECIGFELRSSGDDRLDVENPYAVTIEFGSVTSKLLRSVALRANGTAARMTLMLLPYLRHASVDLGTWYAMDRRDSLNGTPRLWAEAHDLLVLRLAPIGDARDPLNSGNGEERLSRFERLLSTRFLGRLELLVLRQAAEDLDLSIGTRYHADLLTVVLDYLNRVGEIVAGRPLSRGRIEPVLDRLRTHLGTPGPPDLPFLHDKLNRLMDEHAQARKGTQPSLPSEDDVDPTHDDTRIIWNGRGQREAHAEARRDDHPEPLPDPYGPVQIQRSAGWSPRRPKHRQSGGGGNDQNSGPAGSA
ncbi:NACHT domain-containing protein [Nocardiopsis sediminis]|uniref:NACHT domain-containing protein n=1 Tax=Nocardiopsis sediminis TaxID=1778267 RepID=A0ABV8FK02_9ACTN